MLPLRSVRGVSSVLIEQKRPRRSRLGRFFCFTVAWGLSAPSGRSRSRDHGPVLPDALPLTLTLAETDTCTLAAALTIACACAAMQAAALTPRFPDAVTSALPSSITSWPRATLFTSKVGRLVWSALTSAVTCALAVPFTLMATVGGVQLADACAFALQFAWQSASIWHFGGVNLPVQVGCVKATEQEPVHVPLQEPLACTSHAALQVPVQVPLHCPLQEPEPLLPWQVPLHVPLHVPPQVPVHIAPA
jgi:hypothetical protein